MIALLLALRIASYALQSSSGAPLNDTANVRQLARFDDVTLEITPWACDVNGMPRADVPLRLRALNPRIRLWLYALAGDQWLPPSFVPLTNDHSGFRDVFDAVNRTAGWLWGTDGGLWLPNYRVNLANRATVDALGDVYVRLLSTHLFDGLFLDCAHTSIAWTNNGQRQLDYERAGFRSLGAMDSSRAANVRRLVDRIHLAGCYLVARNGTGPAAGEDISFLEGLGSLISPDEATRWMETPGVHWLKAECYSPSECAYKASLLRGIASHGDAIISLGPNRGQAVMP